MKMSCNSSLSPIYRNLSVRKIVTDKARMIKTSVEEQIIIYLEVCFPIVFSKKSVYFYNFGKIGKLHYCMKTFSFV